MSVHQLRDIGRQIGVKHPSMLSKNQLIEEILGIQQGTIVPTFSRKGRPSSPLQISIDKKRILTHYEIYQIEKIIDKAKLEILEFLQKYNFKFKNSRLTQARVFIIVTENHGIVPWFSVTKKVVTLLKE